MAVHPVLGALLLSALFAVGMVLAGVVFFREPIGTMLWLVPLFVVGDGVPMAVVVRRRTERP